MFKTIAVAALATLSLNVFAKEYRTPCEREDWIRLQTSVKAENVYEMNGAEFVDDLKGLMGEEIGPMCDRVTSDEIFVSIPEEHNYDYEIYPSSDRSRGYAVAVAHDFLMDKYRVIIRPLN